MHKSDSDQLECVFSALRDICRSAYMQNCHVPVITFDVQHIWEASNSISVIIVELSSTGMQGSVCVYVAWSPQSHDILYVRHARITLVSPHSRTTKTLYILMLEHEISPFS